MESGGALAALQAMKTHPEEVHVQVKLRSSIRRGLDPKPFTCIQQTLVILSVTQAFNSIHVTLAISNASFIQLIIFL